VLPILPPFKDFNALHKHATTVDELSPAFSRLSNALDVELAPLSE
jgi:hypothetical protein